MRPQKSNLFEIVRDERLEVKLMLVALGFPCEAAGEAADVTIRQVYRDCAWEVYKRRARVGMIATACTLIPPVMAELNTRNALTLSFGGDLQPYWNGMLSSSGTLAVVLGVAAVGLGGLFWAGKRHASSAATQPEDPNGYRDRAVAELTRTRLRSMKAALRDAGWSRFTTFEHH